MKVYVVELKTQKENWPLSDVLCVCDSRELAVKEGDAYIKANYDKWQSYDIEEYDIFTQSRAEIQENNPDGKNEAKESDVYLATDADFSGESDGDFFYIGKNTEVKIPHAIKGVPVTSYYQMFLAAEVTKVVSDNPNVTNMQEMFVFTKAPMLDLSAFDTANVTNMVRMFAFSEAEELDLRGFVTSKVVNMKSMFQNSKATAINVTSFDTSSVVNMEGMFSFAKTTVLDLRSFDTSKVNDATDMFYLSLAHLCYARAQEDVNLFRKYSQKPAIIVAA